MAAGVADRLCELEDMIQIADRARSRSEGGAFKPKHDPVADGIENRAAACYNPFRTIFAGRRVVRGPGVGLGRHEQRKASLDRR